MDKLKVKYPKLDIYKCAIAKANGIEVSVLSVSPDFKEVLPFIPRTIDNAVENLRNKAEAFSTI